MQRAELDLSVLPPWVILVAFVCLISLAGQLRTNRILAVTPVAPVIPSADSPGVTLTAIVVALAAGWALSGASSLFTATTMLTLFASISALPIGWVWNGVYTLACPSFAMLSCRSGCCFTPSWCDGAKVPCCVVASRIGHRRAI